MSSVLSCLLPPRPPLVRADFAPGSRDEESGGPLVIDGPFIETKELAFARLRRSSHQGTRRRDDT
jgi:hypothetical protein